VKAFHLAFNSKPGVEFTNGKKPGVRLRYVVAI